jgi:hypothetical protein
MSNRISVLIDIAVDGANRSLSSFKQSIQDADGAAAKMKAGIGGAFDSIKANAGNLAMAGGAALVAFGAKAVSQFQEVALESGRMSDALRIPVDSMSRLIEVAGDVGVEAGTLETAIGKMNTTAGKTPGYFDEIGASLVRNKDGTLDVQGTFLKTVDALNAMPDAGQRAAAAQKIFGKGWKDMAELIGQGSDTITKSMADVAEGQAISEEEVKKARDYKAAMENLKDAMDNVVLTVGEALVPVLTDMANAVGTVESAVEKLPDPGSEDSFWGGIYNAARNAIDPIHAATDALDHLSSETDDATEAVKGHVEAALGATDATEDGTAATEESTAATQEATRAVDDQVAALEAARRAQEAKNQAVLESLNSDLAYRNQVAETTATLNEYQLVEDDASTAIDEHAQAARDAEAAVMAQAAAAVKLAEDQALANGVTLTAEEKARIYKDELGRLAGFMSGPALDAINGHINALSRIPKSIYTTLGVSSRTGDFGQTTTGVPRAGGGTTQPGEITLVGEQGPEIARFPAGTRITPARQTAAALGAMSGITQHNYFNGITDPAELARLSASEASWALRTAR